MGRPLALVNADVWTSDADSSREEAVLVRDGRIRRVGPEPSIVRLAKKEGARVVDLGGAKVVPGLIDSHTHLVHQGLLRRRVDLQEAPTKAAALARVRIAARNHRGRGPLLAERWDESSWPGHAWPTTEDLDAITTRFPVVMRRVDGHIAVANKAALDAVAGRLPGVDHEKGLLVEEASLHLNRIWPTPRSECVAALVEAQRLALGLGVTAVHDFVVPNYLEAYIALHRRGRLRIRVHATPYVDPPQVPPGPPPPRVAPDEWLRRGGVKAFTDGSLGGHTAALREPYGDDPHNHGRLNWEAPALRSMVQDAARRGLQPSLHAIGDAAIDQVLSTYAELSLAKRRRLRPRIEHFEVHHDEQVAAAGERGVVLSMQPNFVGEWSLKGGLYHQRFGDARFRRNNEFRRILATGAHLAFGSDCMPFDPWRGLESAVRAPHAGQRLPLEDALRAYTFGSAYGIGREKDLGSLERGKRADLVVVEGDWRRRGGIAKTRVLAAMTGGAWVHKRSGVRWRG